MLVLHVLWQHTCTLLQIWELSTCEASSISLGPAGSHTVSTADGVNQIKFITWCCMWLKCAVGAWTTAELTLAMEADPRDCDAAELWPHSARGLNVLCMHATLQPEFV